MPQITTGFILRPHACIQMAIVSYIAYLPRSQIVTVLDIAYLPHSQIITVLDTAYLSCLQTVTVLDIVYLSHLQIITVLDIVYLSHLQIITVLDIVYLAHLQIAIYRPGGYRKRTIQFSGLFSIFWTYSRCSCQVVPLSRPFLRNLFSQICRSNSRSHLRIRLTRDSRNDLRWWLQFLMSWSSISMIQLSRISFDVATDSSDAKGIGGVYN